MNRCSREIDIWGTVIVVELCSNKFDIEYLHDAIDQAEELFIHIDETFSTWKPDSVISRLRRGEIDIESCSDEVKSVWNACGVAREISGGAFDPWIVEGGFDPSGYVKGWAADRACDIFVGLGIESCLINAGGDLAMRGGRAEGEEFVPWEISIRNPENVGEIVHSLFMRDGAVATSGTYEKGAHIRDPFTGLIALGATSATVWGPDGGMADALATAIVVTGKDGAGIFAHPALREYGTWAIDRHEDFSWSVAGSDFSEE